VRHRPFLSRTSELLDTTDWSATPLGPRAQWPLSLRSYVAMVMAMPTPAIIFWGPALTQIYNDGYALIMGPRHPRHFGSPYAECWPDTYALIHPWMRRVLDDAEVVEVERERIPVTRFGFEEDAYFTFTFSPLRDDAGRVAGILQPVWEVTDAVLAERRSDTLRALAMVPATAPLVRAVEVLAANPHDLPFVQLLRPAPPGDRSGTLEVIGAAPPAAEVRQPALDAAAADVLHAREPRTVGSPPTLLLPVHGAHGEPPRAVLAVQLNPRLRRDAAYTGFVDAVARELAALLQRAGALDALERRRAYLDNLFLQAPAGIAVLQGPQHVFELVNPMYRALIGARDVVGLPVRQALPELAGQPFLEILDRVYRDGEPFVGLEQQAQLRRRPGGEPEAVHFNFVYQPMLGDGGAPYGILVLCYEVTQQVLARQHSDALAEELRREHQRKDEFLAMLAHELRNPLAPIKSAAELLRRTTGGDARVQRASEVIARQVGHMSALVNDLLDVSRVTRGLVAIERQPQDLHAVVRDAIEQVRPLIESRGHVLHAEPAARPLWVSGDRKRLVQIFANLLTNAARYTPDGGRIEVRSAADDSGHARVSVTDSGIGIAPELLPRVFDLFVQGERGADRTQGGLGIGLALVRSLAQLHDASVEVASDGAGRGSCFSVRLPLLAPSADHGAADASADAPAEALPHQRGQRLLVVDDNRDAAQMLALQLGQLGYDVEVVHRGEDALRAAARTRFTACLVDIGLPDLHGTDVARRLRADPAAGRPRLIAVSGYGQPADRQRAAEAGFDDYLVKPVDIAPLSRLLRASGAAGEAAA
jgi:signal transduction histidine kinase/ActR/RegA family two-component response regulator